MASEEDLLSNASEKIKESKESSQASETTTDIKQTSSQWDPDWIKFHGTRSRFIKPDQGTIFFCDWFPQLFGIDEEFIPSSEDEEGVFHDFDLEEELEERAQALTESQLANLRETVGIPATTDAELREIWKSNQIPKYGRRAKPKPILERDHHVKFECICDIDRRFSRHYIPHFGGGVAIDGEELKTPHFVAFWEDYKDKGRLEDLNEWNKVLEKKPEKEETVERGLVLRPIPKFQGSSKQSMKNFKQQLLSTVRPLECREIRRYRMPYSEALYLELQEDKYIDSANFFKYLIMKEYYMRVDKEQESPLRDNKSRLNKLVAFLKLAERFSRRKEFHKESAILLKTGKYFNDHDESWWWLAREFYMKAVKVSRKSVIDGGKSEAIARYILGTFLLDYVSDVQNAQEHLSKARELSLGKEWNAEWILNKKHEPIHKECTNHLCRALIAVSSELRKNGKPEEALPLIHNSYKLCREPTFMRRDIEMQTYFELGMTYEELGMLDWAKIAFKKFIEIAKALDHRKSICNGYLELAICFRSEGDFVRCYHNLKNYLETAEELHDENLKAFGNRYLGEYYLNNGNAPKALEYFRKAFSSFHKQWEESLKIPFEEWKPEHLTLPHDVELSRVLVGLSEGEVLTKPICHLILQAKEKNKEETLRLIRWKNKKMSLLEQNEIETVKETAGPIEGDFFFSNYGTPSPQVALCEKCGNPKGKFSKHGFILHERTDDSPKTLRIYEAENSRSRNIGSDIINHPEGKEISKTCLGVFSFSSTVHPSYGVIHGSTEFRRNIKYCLIQEEQRLRKMSGFPGKGLGIREQGLPFSPRVPYISFKANNTDPIEHQDEFDSMARSTSHR